MDRGEGFASENGEGVTGGWSPVEGAIGEDDQTAAEGSRKGARTLAQEPWAWPDCERSRAGAGDRQSL